MKWQWRFWGSTIEYCKFNFFSFVFVAPGRQFLKPAKGHNRYWSCEQCKLQGLHELSYIVFHTIDCTPRVNDIFNNYGYTWKHQIQQSSLNDFGINWINRFLLDYIHLVCLGVVKRLILFWKEGLQGPHRYHSTVITNVKEAGRNDGTVSIRFCVVTTWVWWGQKMEGNRIVTVSAILKLYCLDVYFAS